MTSRSTQAVVHVVAHRQAHGGDLAAILVQREAGDVALIFEGAVALVDVEIVGLGVVGHQQVGLAVVVHVDKDGGEAVVSAGIGDAGFHADVGKGAVAVVVEEVVGLALQSARAAHHGNAVQLAEGESDAAVVGRVG